MPSSPRPRSASRRVELQGALWLAVGGQALGGPQRIGLLRAIAEHGTLTAAAQALGLSYKGAWEALQSMNAHAAQPLVERVTGGRGGGFTRLTPHAQRLVERYAQIEAVHQRFMRQLSDSAMNLDEPFSLLKVLNMKTSARNQWLGEVAAIRAGAVNDEVELHLSGGARLVATITRDSSEALGLRLKQPVIALVKASSVLLATGLGTGRLSAQPLRRPGAAGLSRRGERRSLGTSRRRPGGGGHRQPGLGGDAGPGAGHGGQRAGPGLRRDPGHHAVAPRLLRGARTRRRARGCSCGFAFEDCMGRLMAHERPQGRPPGPPAIRRA